MHIIWGYIRSLGFKLLDERQLWINVIFSLTYGHLLRAREKKSLYALLLLIFLITVPWGSLSFWNTLNDGAMSLISDIYLSLICVIQHTITKQYCCCFMPSVCHGRMYGKSLGHTGEELICWARENTTRRGQTVKGLNAIHLLTCSRCAWLMSSSFGGEHMSTAAVPPWIGSDCVRANCIPGSQAKSEWSELSHFWYKRLLHSTWFTCLFFHRTGGRSLWPK